MRPPEHEREQRELEQLVTDEQRRALGGRFQDTDVEETQAEDAGNEI